MNFGQIFNGLTKKSTQFIINQKIGEREKARANSSGARELSACGVPCLPKEASRRYNRHWRRKNFTPTRDV